MRSSIGLTVGVLLASGIAAGVAVGLGQPGHGDARLRKLKVVIETTGTGDGGTDANIYLGATWHDGNGSDGSVFELPSRKSDFEKGQTSTVGVSIPESARLYGVPLGALGTFMLINGMNGDRPGWHVRAVHIFGYADDGHTYLLSDTTVDRWLDTKENSGPAVVIPVKSPPRDLGLTDQVGDAPSTMRAIESWPSNTGR